MQGVPVDWHPSPPSRTSSQTPRANELSPPRAEHMRPAGHVTGEDGLQTTAHAGGALGKSADGAQMEPAWQASPLPAARLAPLKHPSPIRAPPPSKQRPTPASASSPSDGCAGMQVPAVPASSKKQIPSSVPPKVEPHQTAAQLPSIHVVNQLGQSAVVAQGHSQNPRPSWESR